MSSRPGTKLEDYLLWRYDLTADGDYEPNRSLSIAEALGHRERRFNLNAEQLKELAAIFETWREHVEYLLLDYDEEESGSWRDYAGLCFDFIDDRLDKKAEEFIASLKNQSGTTNA